MNNTILTDEQLILLQTNAIKKYIENKIAFYNNCLLELQEEINSPDNTNNEILINRLQGQMQTYYSNIKSMRNDLITLGFDDNTDNKES